MVKISLENKSSVQMEKVLKTNVLWAKRMLPNLQTQADFTNTVVICF